VRNEVRSAIEADGVSFIEVFARCPISVLAERDIKGLYKKALAGELKEFTGISDPYEDPESAEVVVETDRESIEAGLNRIVQFLERRALLPVRDRDRTNQVCTWNS
jgi:adenylylsulfate kinase-like enzyme